MSPVGGLHLRGIVCVPHIANLDKHGGVLGKVESSQIRTTVHAVRADIAGRLHSCGEQGIAHDTGQLDRRAALRIIEWGR
jgi:hypothetical protein